MYSLNINKRINDWSPVDSVKEFINNSIDEHKQQTLSLSDVKIVYNGSIIQIIDKGRGTTEDNFNFGRNPEKIDKTFTIGQFGKDNL